MRHFLLLLFIFCYSVTAALPLANDWYLRGTPQALQPNGDSLAIPFKFPGRTEILTHVKDHSFFKQATHVNVLLDFSKDFPADSAVITIFTKDKDSLWRQIRTVSPMPSEDGSVSIKIPVKGREAVESWEACRHNRPWSFYTAGLINEFGILIEPRENYTGEYEGTFTLRSITAENNILKKYDTPVRDLYYSTTTPEVGSPMLVSFRLDCWPSAPFDSESTSIKASILTPDNTTEEINGFYYEDFLYDADEWDKTKCLHPNGEPSFRIRYCPRQPGKHIMNIRCEIDGETFIIPAINFDAKKAPDTYHGFIHVDSQSNQFFCYDDNSYFWGLGINLRSPFDTRYMSVAPFSQWEDMGLAVYDKLMYKYKQSGINVIEVWMSSWWLALEWIDNEPGFHGVGHYNQYRAWMLDYIFELARKYDIKIILVINNHGKFSQHLDTEWAFNPFNVKNGGYLNASQEYYSNPQANKDTKKLLDYISARWGAYPELLTWKLFTEIDLTGPNMEFYRNPVVKAWHEQMGSYLKQIDIYKHMVTTHWMLSYRRINRELAVIPELDFVSTDAYYDMRAGIPELINLLKTGKDFGKQCGKPLVITEFGGSSMADDMNNLIKQVPLALWTGFFSEMGILPMNWWFALIDDQNLYKDYKVISDFGAKEDRRHMQSSISYLQNSLCVNCLKSKDRLLCWIYDVNYYCSGKVGAEAKSFDNTVVSLAAPEPGDYTLEIWDLQNCKIQSSEKISVSGELVTLTIPTFSKHIAFKLVK